MGGKEQYLEKEARGLKEGQEKLKLF